MSSNLQPPLAANDDANDAELAAIPVTVAEVNQAVAAQDDDESPPSSSSSSGSSDGSSDSSSSSGTGNSTTTTTTSSNATSDTTSTNNTTTTTPSNSTDTTSSLSTSSSTTDETVVCVADRSVRLENLHKDITVEQVKQHFTAAHPDDPGVLDVQLVPSLSQAIVVVKNWRSLRRALQMDLTILRGRQLRVSRYSPPTTVEVSHEDDISPDFMQQSMRSFALARQTLENLSLQRPEEDEAVLQCRQEDYSPEDPEQAAAAAVSQPEAGPSRVPNSLLGIPAIRDTDCAPNNSPCNPRISFGKTLRQRSEDEVAELPLDGPAIGGFIVEPEDDDDDDDDDDDYV